MIIKETILNLKKLIFPFKEAIDYTGDPVNVIRMNQGSKGELSSNQILHLVTQNRLNI